MWSNDTTNKCGIDINSFTSSFNLHQLITEPTHILQNSISCIDPIFSNQPNLILQKGVIPSLHENCHHQVVHASFDLRVCYPPPYERVLWDYKKANADLIQRSVREFDLLNLLTGLHPDNQVELLNDTLLIIMRNFIPFKKTMINDKDIPWVTDEIKILQRKKTKSYSRFVSKGCRKYDLDKLKKLTEECSSLIPQERSNYLCKLGVKLNRPDLCPKSYWATLNKLLNKKKMPNIPPLLFDDNFVN